MQGRLSPTIDGLIQAFPWRYWREEFGVAESNGFHIMEWTLDHARLNENPLMTLSGQAEIRALRERHGVAIPSLTGDCFMQMPFWKAQGEQAEALKTDFDAISKACATVGIGILVVPLVDNGRLENRAQEDLLVDCLLERKCFLADMGLQVAFESDYLPAECARFIGRLPAEHFGINYDIGNSAALGFAPADEFAAYGDRIVNVHVKDRLLGGTTVPLGTGNADFAVVFDALRRIDYRSNFILQTARANDGEDARALCAYREITREWMRRYGLEGDT